MDKNGIRDDVQTELAQRFKGKQLGDAIVNARAFQVLILSQGKTDRKGPTRAYQTTMQCMLDRYGQGGMQKIAQAVIILTVNNKLRASIYAPVGKIMSDMYLDSETYPCPKKTTAK